MCRGELPFKFLPVGNGRWIDDAGSLPIHEQEVVAGAGLERRFAQRDATPGRRIELFVILNGPATRSKLRVDLTTGKFFRLGQRCIPLTRATLDPSERPFRSFL